MPAPQTAKQREFEARIKQYRSDLARHQGMSRRAFFKTAAGMAAAFVAMNETYGQLYDASRAEGRESQSWRFLAVAYGRDNQIAMSALAQAEQAMANGNKREARLQARRALKGLAAGSPGWLRANDIVSAAGGPEGEDDEGSMP